jgi:L-lactate dehydrogenase
MLYPVSVLLQGEYGVEGVAASVPVIIGENGVEEIKRVKMAEDEEAGFYASVDVIREAAEKMGLLEG